MARDSFLRSINVQLDVDHPDRLLHFRPTSKSVELVRSVFDASGDRALLVVAPYGSGKSLTASYLLHAIQNEPERFVNADYLLEEVADRIEGLDSSLGQSLRNRARDETLLGVGASLHGQVSDTTEALREALKVGFGRAGLGRQARSFERVESGNRESIEQLLAVATEKLDREGRDRLLIVWDEFGRHLEALVSEGRPGELLDLQVLAEAASRSSKVQVNLVMLLHRSFMGYASSLPTEIRKEWNKVEGRFRVVQYVDDSHEMRRLLAGIIGDLRGSLPVPQALVRQAAARVQAAGLFEEVAEGELIDLLSDAWPVEPATVWLLPRVAARVAQNERTSFSFLNSVELSDSVGPDALYDYFRGEFRSDSGPGGTHKPWLETESALAKVAPGSAEATILKTAFLLNLGLEGERSSTSRERLEITSAGWEAPSTALTGAVDELLEKKLLIHRRHTDQIVVWHGTDVDLRGRLRDERQRMESGFDLIGFLEQEMPPPLWRPTRHNAERGVPRYLESRFVSADGLAAWTDKLELGLWEPGTDGEVLYVLPESADRLEAAEATAAQIADHRTFVAVARAPERLRRAAIELAALLRMHQDAKLLSQDPLIRDELNHLTDDAREALLPLLERVVTPGAGGAKWYHAGENIPVSSPTHFRRYLSAAMDAVFHKTPAIASEMVVRRRPTPVVINARKKVELGILERYGEEALGIEGNFADMAIFRSVFLNTGWYRLTDDRWRLAGPEEIEDPGLRAAWAEVGEFLTRPRRERFLSLTQKLIEPPFGVREGLLPLFVAAGLKAFPAPRAIRGPNGYVGDILPSVVEDICRDPGDFELEVLETSEADEALLIGLLQHFGADRVLSSSSDELLRRVFDALQYWWDQLPGSAKTSTNVSDDARRFRALVRSEDPAVALLQRLPKEFSESGIDHEEALARVRAAEQELTQVHQYYVKAAGRALTHALKVRGIQADTGVMDATQAWARHFPEELTLSSLSALGRSTLMQMRRRHRNTEGLLNALALLLTQKSFKQWEDATIPEFERRLRASLDDIEHAALEEASGAPTDSSLTQGVADLARLRVRLALRQMEELLGADGARRTLEEEVLNVFPIIVTEESN